MNENKELFVKIAKEELKDLLEGYFHYCALESGGVDNWSWYGESCKDFLRENKVKTFSELTNQVLNDYEEVI